MSLLARQHAFLAEIAAADDEDTLPPSSPGMAIYRNAYRARLLAALETSFELTRRWAGEGPFTAAASHFILTAPPVGWTLDAYGADFPTMLASLFPQDPELAELAWLEWHRQQAFAAPDRPTLDPAELSAAGLDEAEWADLRFTMAAGFATRAVTSNGAALWLALERDDDPASFRPGPPDGDALLVWRAGLSPRHRLASAEECGALLALAAGQPLSAIAAGCDPARLGAWLAQWLSEGIFAAAIR